MSFLRDLEKIGTSEFVTVKMSAAAATRIVEIIRAEEEEGVKDNDELFWVYYDSDKTTHLTTEDGLSYDNPLIALCCGAWVDPAHLFDVNGEDCPHCGHTLYLDEEETWYSAALERLDAQRAALLKRMKK
jgi:hypothetical protein